MDTNASPIERYLTPIAVIVGAGLIALAVAYGQGGSVGTKTPIEGETYAEVLSAAAEANDIDAEVVAAKAEEKRAAYEALIAASRDQGASLGINGTPTVILGNETVAGLDPALLDKLAAATANPVTPSATDLIAKVTTAGEPYVGDPNAPVTMAYYYDYQCGFCHQFMREVMPVIFEQYVTTGKLKIVIKDFQFLSPDSVEGAVYGRALWEVDPTRHFGWFMALGQLDASH
ncbi:MAG: thioredoxin domain-containing protein [Candidatus Pacebacteria bacterium]|nr:thioredoxin domain-containing protein [Candidatus Paceibacterota bacterium]MBP9840326.1 thioredoxin domain-containing protein [Candidatus Paceibacterota bacterium]